ncbi:hypothetical protein HDU86_005314 [Geranomyces michiganensis]|nr:hypothetical protein HDU86_005314 [Geranomyces michiganensis]
MSDSVRPRTGRAEKHQNQPAQLSADENYDEDFESGSEPQDTVDDEGPDQSLENGAKSESSDMHQPEEQQTKSGTLSNWASRIMHKVLDSATAEIETEAAEITTPVSPGHAEHDDAESPREQSRPSSAMALPPAPTTQFRASRPQSRSQSQASLTGSSTGPAALPPLSADTPRAATASRAGSRAGSQQSLLPPPADSTIPLVEHGVMSGSSSRGDPAKRALPKSSRTDLASQSPITPSSGRQAPTKTATRSSGHPADSKPPKASIKKVEVKHHRDGTQTVTPTSMTSAEQSAAYQHALVLQLRAQVIKLKQQLGEREGAIDLLRAREAELRAASAAGPRAGRPIDKETRIQYDRQKKAYQILVQKLRREVRRLKFQRNSLADPLIETNYFPYLPRSVDGITARSLARTAASAARSTTSDHFAMNPPPATGNHPESGNRWWWGSGPSLGSHLPRPKTAPLETTRNLHVRKRQLHENGGGAPAPRVGDRVAVNVRGEACMGTLEYVGEFGAHPETGLWCGIALDLPGN